MLQTHTVESALLELLIKLMQQELFFPFTLVGGTALALQTGHRKSIDIDMFGNQPVDEISFTDILNEVGKVRVLSKSNNILIYTINGIKVDFVNYRYNWLEKPLTLQSVRLASKKDIAAMKLNAIAGRGSRKDFFDLHELLNYFSLEDILDFYDKKYPDGSKFMAIKSLTYFDDADREQNPELIKSTTWGVIKKKIIKEVKNLI